eukprot:364241-Chlamydomonas_euryale.AAC.12
MPAGRGEPCREPAVWERSHRCVPTATAARPATAISRATHIGNVTEPPGPAMPSGTIRMPGTACMHDRRRARVVVGGRAGRGGSTVLRCPMTGSGCLELPALSVSRKAFREGGVSTAFGEITHPNLQAMATLPMNM